jgi:endonuclease/exonuclease/phosphatase (EEP) superfamily protein YafD
MAQITEGIRLEQRRARAKPRVRRGVLVIPALVALGTLASFLGAWWWGFELLSNFRPHAAALSLLVVLYAVARRSPLAIIIGFACLIANGIPLTPYLSGRSAAADLPRSVRVMTANLHGDTTVLPKLRKLIEKEQPDVVLLTEVPPNMPAVPMTLFPDYPETLFSQRGAFEVMVLSRWTLGGPHFDRTVAEHLPVLSAELCNPANPSVCMAFVGLHATLPFRRTVQSRDAQLRLAAKLAFARGDIPVLLMGDLNATPWSPTFTDLLADGELRDVSVGRGLSTTWPAACLLCGVLIDHILVNPKITVLASRVADDIGSDHRPVVADLAFLAATP